MAGGKKKVDITKLAERRDKKLATANKYFLKMQRLEAEAESLDMRVTEECDHPDEFRKLKRFTEGFPQSGMWLCTLCYQMVETKAETKKKEKIKENIKKDIEQISADIKSKTKNKR